MSEFQSVRDEERATAGKTPKKPSRFLGLIDRFAVEEQLPSVFGCTLSLLVYIFVAIYVALTAIEWMNAPNLVEIEPRAYQTTASKIVIGCESVCGCSYSMKYDAVLDTTTDCRNAVGNNKTGTIAFQQVVTLPFCYSPLLAEGIYVKGQVGFSQLEQSIAFVRVDANVPDWKLPMPATNLIEPNGFYSRKSKIVQLRQIDLIDEVATPAQMRSNYSIGVVNDGGRCGAAPLVCSTDAYNAADKSQANKLAELSGYNILGFSMLSDIGALLLNGSLLPPATLPIINNPLTTVAPFTLAPTAAATTPTQPPFVPTTPAIPSTLPTFTLRKRSEEEHIYEQRHQHHQQQHHDDEHQHQQHQSSNSKRQAGSSETLSACYLLQKDPLVLTITIKPSFAPARLLFVLGGAHDFGFMIAGILFMIGSCFGLGGGGKD